MDLPEEAATAGSRPTVVPSRVSVAPAPEPVDLTNVGREPTFEAADVALNLGLRWSVLTVFLVLGVTGLMPVNQLALAGTTFWFMITNSICSYFWIKRRPMGWSDTRFIYLDYVTVVCATLALANLSYPVWMAFVLLMIQAPAERPTGSAVFFNTVCALGYVFCAVVMYAAGWYTVDIGVASVTVAILLFIGLNMAMTFDSNRRLQQVIHSLAVTDALTGLANRRRFSHYLANPPQDTTLAVILMDVDRFKGYNDAFGHLAGDQLLARLARILEESFPDAAIISRYGGDEFVVLLPCVAAEGAERRVHELLYARSSDKVPVTVGIALWPDHHPTLDAAFAAADDCLRAAKRSQRGTYASWSVDGQIELRAS